MAVRLHNSAWQSGRIRPVNSPLSSMRASPRNPQTTIFLNSSVFRRVTCTRYFLQIGQLVTDVNRVANTFMRAPGESIGTFAVESAIDALAYEVGLDPIELRMRNEPDRDPVSGHTNSPVATCAKPIIWEQKSSAGVIAPLPLLRSVMASG